MLIRTCMAAFLMVCSVTAAALDASDEGVYAVVHRDGHITSKRIRLLRIGDEWLAEDVNDKGQAENCPSCVLRTSTSADVENFMGGPPPDGMAAECVQNKLMAICRITEGKPPEVSRQYGFVALTQNKPFYLKLARVAALAEP